MRRLTGAASALPARQLPCDDRWPVRTEAPVKRDSAHTLETVG